MANTGDLARLRGPGLTGSGDPAYERRVRQAMNEIGVAVEFFPAYVNTTLNLHQSTAVLMSFFVSGHGKHVMGDQIYEETGGSLGITHYGQAHDILTGPEGMDVVNIYIDLQTHPLPPMPESLQAVLPEILPLHSAFHNRLNRRVRLVFDDPAAVAAHLWSMEQELQRRSPGWREVVRLRFQLFLVDCCRAAVVQGAARAQEGAADSSAIDTRLEVVRRRLDTDYAQPQTLDDLAAMAGCSRGHLCRAFKHYTGRTVLEYLTHRRIQSAMLALRLTDEKLHTIALQTGFGDLSHFIRTFTRLVGDSPARYRRSAPRTG